MRSFFDFTINHRETIREAFKKEGLNKKKFILVLDDDNKVIGIVTDGDFRRTIWNSVSLEDSIGTIANRNFKFLTENYNIDEYKQSIKDFIDLFMIGYEWEDKINYDIVDSLDKLISEPDVAFYKNYFMSLDEEPPKVHYNKTSLISIFKKIRNKLKMYLKWK